jgi:hypothetical protein
MVPLSAWANFYVIAGSSAGALTGLTFVVISFIVGRQTGSERRGLNAFSTPIVVHFTVVLLLAALLSAPWTVLSPVAFLLGLGSLGGLVYACIVVWRLGHVVSYQPEWDDWLWYGVLPVLAYTALLLSALLLQWATTPLLFVVAAALLLLLAVGIRDAWDVVTYLAFMPISHPDSGSEDETSGSEQV